MKEFSQEMKKDSRGPFYQGPLGPGETSDQSLAVILVGGSETLRKRAGFRRLTILEASGRGTVLTVKKQFVEIE